MKKSLLLLALCLGSLSTYAQDDDVYFVPSSKDKVQSNDTYTAPGRSSYSPISGNEDNSTFQSSNWANGRGNGKWNVDDYNRRGRNYKSNVSDTLDNQQTYNQGYEDGYEDGSCTARIVRFCSPRAGIYVSSPYYLDYYDLCYDPFYYGYGSPWSISWSGWWGWGSWYGWRPYYSSWYGWGTTLGMVAQVGAGEVGMAVGPHGVPLTSMVATGTWAIRIVPLSMQTIVPQPAMALADVAATSVSLTIDPPSVAHLMGRTTALR